MISPCRAIERLSWLGLGCALVLLAGWAAAARSEHPRQRLFAEDETPLAFRLAEPARLTVLFHPDAGQCAPQEIATIRALRRLAAEHTDIRVLSVLPVSLAETQRLGEQLPGEIVRHDDQLYLAEQRVAPTPRLEVWNGSRLLLMRSLPGIITEDEIYEEVLWARAFTAPPG